MIASEDPVEASGQVMEEKGCWVNMHQKLGKNIKVASIEFSEEQAQKMSQLMLNYKN
jgi:hypothetical protein